MFDCAGVRLRLALAAACVTVGLVVSGGQASASTTFSQLPLNGFRSMTVDDVNSHVFVSGNPPRATPRSRSSISTGRSSSPSPAFLGHLGWRGMETWIYVAQCGASGVAVIDAGTLDVAETIDTGAPIGGTCQVAVGAGRIWFVTGGGLLASVSETSPHASGTYAGLGTFTAPLLTAGGSRLVLADTDVDIGNGGTPAVRVYDLSHGDPQLQVSGYPDFGGYGIRNFVDASLSADGSTMVLAVQSPHSSIPPTCR